MLSSLFILSDIGDVLIEKHWKGLINRTICEYFWDQVLASKKDNSIVPPIISTPKYYLINIQRDKVYFLGVLQSEVPPLLVIDFLQRIYETFVAYFDGTITEASIKDHFVVVYQLLDEMGDNGFPFTTELNFLKEMIKPSGVISNVISSVTGSSGNVTDALPNGSLGAINWRKTGIKYASNEIFFDIIEEIDCIIDNNGHTVSCEINGEILANCRLSGMPDLTLTFNNPRMLDDVSFHPCVRYSKWENDRVLSFIPPDGQFKLFTYRVKGVTQLPLFVKPQISFGEGGGRVNVSAGPKGGPMMSNSKTVIENVLLTIPFSKSVSTTNLSCNVGSYSMEEATKVCKWNIGRIPKDKSPLLSGYVNLIPGQPAPESNPSIMVQFKITGYAISGLSIDVLTCSEAYKPYKGVRAVTKAGKYQVRA